MSAKEFLGVYQLVEDLDVANVENALSKSDSDPWMQDAIGVLRAEATPGMPDQADTNIWNVWYGRAGAEPRRWTGIDGAFTAEDRAAMAALLLKQAETQNVDQSAVRNADG